MKKLILANLEHFDPKKGKLIGVHREVILKLIEELHDYIDSDSAFMICSTSPYSKECAKLLCETFKIEFEENDFFLPRESSYKYENRACRVIGEKGGQVDILIVSVHVEFSQTMANIFVLT